MKIFEKFLCFLFFAPIGAIAQQEKVSFTPVNISNDNFAGPNQGIQDFKGYLWIATRNGLFRYDGSNETYYYHQANNTNSICSNGVNCVCSDRNGNIWIGTSTQGVDCLDPETGIFKHFKHDQNKNSLINDTVFTIKEDHIGMIWIGTEGGLDCFDPAKNLFTGYLHSDTDTATVSNNHIMAIYEDRSNVLWVGTGNPAYWTPGVARNEGGLNRLDRRTGVFTHYTADSKDPQHLIDNRVTAIFEDSRNNFWIGTGGDGLHTMDRAKGVFQRHLYDPKHPEKLSRPPLPKTLIYGDDYVTFIAEDSSGMIWVGSTVSGMNRYNPFTQFTSHHVIKFSGIENDKPVQYVDSGASAAFSSRDGTFWVCSASLVHMDPYFMRIPFFTHKDEHAFPFHEVYCVFQDNKDERYIGCSRSLTRINLHTGKQQYYTHDSTNSKSISDNVVNVIRRCKDGKLWIGTNTCLDKFDPQKNTFTHYVFDPVYPKEPNRDNVNDLLQDKDDIWIGTRHGLYLMNQETGKFLEVYQHNPKDSNSLSNNTINILFRDQEQRIWVGDWDLGGLNLLDKASGRFKHYLLKQSISSFAEDQKGVMWVGTIGGLYYLDRKSDQFIRFSDPNGVIEINNIMDLFEDAKNNLWVCMKRVILRINPARNAINIFDSNFGVNYQGDWGYGACTHGIDGEIFLGYPMGYYAFNPDSITTNEKIPEILINSLLVKNEEIKRNPGANKFSVPLWQAKEIRLKYDQNIFSLQFAVIHYSIPGKNKAMYTLANYDDGWHVPGDDMKAYYYNVPPGKYIFKIKAASSYNLWTEKDITIIITPPWWQTWWARILFVSAIASVIFLFYRNRINRLKTKQQQQMKTMVATQEEERKRISRDLHDDVGTKLSALKLFISSFKSNVTKQNYNEAETLAGNAEELINETMKDVREMLLNLSPGILEEFGYTTAVESLINKINTTKAICFKLVVFGITDRLPKEYELALYRITQELINNVLKHAEAKKVSLQIGYRDKKIVLMIEDDGKGFDAVAHKDGYGLKNLEARTKLLGGTMHIESVVGRGTSILIEVPFQT